MIDHSGPSCPRGCFQFEAGQGQLLRQAKAGFVTYAHLRGASDRAIVHQSRHRSLATIGAYVRIHEAWEDNAATQLGQSLWVKEQVQELLGEGGVPVAGPVS
jgi:hypothetical protein